MIAPRTRFAQGSKGACALIGPCPWWIVGEPSNVLLRAKYRCTLPHLQRYYVLLRAKYRCRCGNVIPIVPQKLNSVGSANFGKRIAVASVMPDNSVEEYVMGFFRTTGQRFGIAGELFSFFWRS